MSSASSAPTSSKSLKRLSNEYSTLSKQPLPYASVELQNGDFMKWTVKIEGPKGNKKIQRK